MAVGIIVNVLIAALGVVFLAGKGSSLIAGFNTMPREEREMFDEKKLCRFMGIMTLIIAVLIGATNLGAWLKLAWLGTIAGALIAAVGIFMIVFLNTGKRFQKSPDKKP